jgi:hypothetical protein
MTQPAKSGSARFVNRTHPLTPWLRIGRWRVRLEFKPADLWLGLYVAPDETWRSGSAWLCLLPWLPVHVDWWQS